MDGAGQVSIATRPAGAAAVVSRYQADPRGRYELVDRRELGTTPVATLELAPGSYLLELEADGRTPVRYPFVAQRGGSNDLDLRFPAADEIPEGFVYVPPGEFLVGYAGSETVRNVLRARARCHRRFQDAFAIARHEVTFTDCIEFLEAAPASAGALLPPGDPTCQGSRASCSSQLPTGMAA